MTENSFSPDSKLLHALNAAEFQRFCDSVAEDAAARGLTEDKLAEILDDDA